MNPSLTGKKIAILSTDGFEESELLSPREALEKAGASTFVISPRKSPIKGWDGSAFTDPVKVDQLLSEANADDFDALLLPGGVINPDKLRIIPEAVHFVRKFFAAGKPVGAICHGPQLLIEAGVVEGRTLTSVQSIRTDLINAGARWVNESVVCDQGLVTSRTPDDLPDFNAKLIEEIAEGVHAGQHA